eukprot:905160_1
MWHVFNCIHLVGQATCWIYALLYNSCIDNVHYKSTQCSLTKTVTIVTALHSCSETNGLKNAMTAIDIGRHLRSPQSPLANRGLRAYVDLEGDARTESDSDHAWTLASLNLYFASRDS